MSEIPHLGYIVAAFAVAGIVIVAMIAATLADYRDLSARLEKLDGQRRAGAAMTPARVALMGLPLAVALALVGLFYLRLGAGDASNLPSALIGEPAPALALPALAGGAPGAADLRAGKVTVVNVFGSWCAPCHVEHPVLMQLAQSPDAKAGRIAIVGMAQKDSPENVRRFLAAQGDPYGRVVLDADGRAGIDWGVYGVPETFVIRGDGTIAYKYVGPLTQETLASTLMPQIRKAEN